MEKAPKKEGPWETADRLAREDTIGFGYECAFASTARQITLREAGPAYVKAFTMTEKEYHDLVDKTLEANGFMPKHSLAGIFFRTAARTFNPHGSVYNGDGTVSKPRAVISLENFVKGFHEYCKQIDATIMHPEHYNMAFGESARTTYLNHLDRTIISFIEHKEKTT